MHPGQGPGLSPHDLGEKGGSKTVPLLESEIPAHSHQIRAAGADPGDLQAPSPSRAVARSGGGFAYAAGTPNVQMAPETLPPAGGGQPHNNMQPYLTLNFCIALRGVFPPRG